MGNTTMKSEEKKQMEFVLLLVLHLVAVCGVAALRAVKMAVPVAVRVGSSVSLACDYDLENEALYSIRWYHADQEFYRFVPKDQPPFKVFALPSFNVDMSASDSRRVRLNDVHTELSGEYKCEVSADAPLFHTDIRSSHMAVVEVPREGPSLSTDTTKIGVGATLKANCTSPASAHRINLTWYLNGEPLKPPSPMYTAAIINIMSLSNPLYPLETATVTTIAIDVTPLMFKTGKMRVRCLATMFTLYRRTVELELLEDVPHVAMIIKPTPKPPPNYQIYTGYADASPGPQPQLQLLLLLLLLATLF